MSRLPLIGVTICSRQIGLHAYHISGDKYVHAMASVAKGVPLILPSLADPLAPSDILDGLDCILFTRSPSNIEPFHRGSPANKPGSAHDSARTSSFR
ncbi:gamma-glutamyl-gamma-aminobutyrate hydrolase family protein [Pseudomonas sp. TH03]|nr:gamma-glutamyl-gamma-aminobutyrate hydrolase family protein [Pseudomonas sp. TH15]MBK5553411.1 gamma-glutamyl-gamma-aminobutyrate hydrolase family protein [Pseudomonas sp. TH03]